ncbi:MAG: preprotein translocase subunit SecE [Alphaproteobacteria bacterium]|jgi:preprotein translocase subunit SecE|nr:preprotein translocase subunit SecE [Alphaproteobacteria bacterium]MBU2292564.1 preprotein translocase subunit SecE [Alphaproteobacteria bacterium]MBU2382278.1 preprotein translocase subunit SecE [Alphaproteobacteria bacterium]
MAKAKSPSGRRTQPAQPVIAGAAVAADTAAPKKRTSIPQFASQVRAELRKVVWPSRKETWITSVMVLIMVVIAAIFFFVVDAGLSVASRFILGLGGQ